MRRAVREHLVNVIALLALVALACGVAGYILAQQRLRFPLIEPKPHEVELVLPDGQAVTPGQGQTVRVAGLRVGDISAVRLERGRAVLTLALDPEHSRLVHTDATALLRPKTPLKDMFVELDPGSKRAPVLPEGERITVSNSLSDVDADEMLSALDGDTRAYLKLLVTGAGKGLSGRGDDLRESLARLGPLHRDVGRVSRAVAGRRHDLRRLVHNYAELTNELADKDGDLTRLVGASNSALGALASEDRNLSRAVAKLPGALRQTETTLGKIDTLGGVLGPAADDLRPVMRRLDRANRELLPFGRAAEPSLRRGIRPFVRAARPYVRDLRPAARDLGAATPDLTTSLFEVNRLLNMAAYNPGGAEPLTGNRTKDLARDEGHLFWAAWAGHLGVSVFNTADASGPLRRAQLTAGCDTIRDTLGQQAGGALVPLLNLTPILNDPALCGTSAP